MILRQAGLSTTQIIKYATALLCSAMVVLPVPDRPTSMSEHGGLGVSLMK